MLQALGHRIGSLVPLIKFALTPKSAIGITNEKLLSTAVLKTNRIAEIDTVLAKLLPGRAMYEAVAAKVHKDMPWWFILMTHAMEAGAKQKPFNYHLHCGDPLYARTVNVPAGRPKFAPGHGIKPPSGTNPYTWEESAIDALFLMKFDKVTEWSIGNILYEFEKFNGLGYRKYHSSVPTPYVWSFTSVYIKGKYITDGKWDANAVSQQPGCAAYYIRLKQTGQI